MPQFIVNSGKAKCLSVSAPEGTVLKVEYEAPDLHQGKTSNGKVYITANLSRPAKRARDYATPLERREKLALISNIKAHSETIERTTAGSFTYDVTLDGEVDVCVRATYASMTNPMRFGLRVTTVKPSSSSSSSAANAKANANDASKGEGDAVPSTKKIDDHMSSVELQTTKLKEVLREILAEADYAKEREMLFHNQSVSMNAASMWWPIVQLCVLLVTGFTQASHIVRFFKRRHII